MNDVRDRVAIGIAWLDSVEPYWYLRIDPEKLNVSSPTDCVCGQLDTGHEFEEYVMRLTGLVKENALVSFFEWHGFLQYDRDEEELLTKEWKKEVLKLQRQHNDEYLRTKVEELKEAIARFP